MSCYNISIHIHSTYIYIHAYIEIIVFLLQNVIQHHAEWMNIAREQPLTMGLCYIGASCYRDHGTQTLRTLQVEQSNPPLTSLTSKRVTCDFSNLVWWGIKLLGRGRHGQTPSLSRLGNITTLFQIHLYTSYLVEWTSICKKTVMSFLLITKWPGFNVCSFKK